MGRPGFGPPGFGRGFGTPPGGGLNRPGGERRDGDRNRDDDDDDRRERGRPDRDDDDNEV
jgi:hypothetical protein